MAAKDKEIAQRETDLRESQAALVKERSALDAQIAEKSTPNGSAL